MSEIPAIVICEMWAGSDPCAVCEAEVVASCFGRNFGVPMFEGEIVPAAWTGEWGGFTVCERCFHLAEAIERPMTPADLLSEAGE